MAAKRPRRPGETPSPPRICPGTVPLDQSYLAVSPTAVRVCRDPHFLFTASLDPRLNLPLSPTKRTAALYTGSKLLVRPQMREPESAACKLMAPIYPSLFSAAHFLRPRSGPSRPMLLPCLKSVALRPILYGLVGRSHSLMDRRCRSPPEPNYSNRSFAPGACCLAGGKKPNRQVGLLIVSNTVL